ncbi:MAG: glycosyltransferase [Betaproteobacteria bacterium]|nr:glycosyltransferase [Betaproteobacteria bacterium]
MRIVIDLQGFQATHLPDVARFSLALSLALARNAGEHEILLALNGCFQDMVEPIRAAFADYLPQQNILVWEADAPLAAANPDNACRRKVAECVREAFLAALRPDFVLLTNLFAGFADNAAISIGRQTNLATAIILHPSTQDDTPEFAAWHEEKQAQLRCATWVFPVSGECDLTGIAPENILNLSDLFASSSGGEHATSAIPDLKAWVTQADDLWPQAEFDQAAEQILAALPRRAAKSSPPAFFRKRLAYVSPLPPERSGISDYSAELLPFLYEWYDIEVIVAQAEVGDAWIRQNCPIRDVAWFRANANRFDRTLYHFGNSPFHRHMFALLEEVPGVVALHDFFLSDIQAYRAFEDGSFHLWEQAFHASHGYHALSLNHENNMNAVIMEYPANLPVLQAARGVIVHSEFSRRLARRWYGDGAGQDWAVLPHLRMPAGDVDREGARQALGLEAEHFLVCAFGMLGPTKQNKRLLEAWLASPLAKDEQALLVFVGENGNNDYGREISRKIRECGMGRRIQITGWADSATFRHYLAAADIGVQLRTLSRGETSGTVLDCMNHGLATIVNAHGSLADLDPTALWMLPDNFSNRELTEALTTLWRDPVRRRTLGEKGRTLVAERHAPEQCAAWYAEAIESFYRADVAGWVGLLPALSPLFAAAGKEGRRALAGILAHNFPPAPRKRQLLVDVSAMVETDLKTGIQRVVRAVLGEWLAYADADLRVEPVYAAPEGYRYARRFTCNFLEVADCRLEDAPVDAWPGDIFFGLDFHNAAVPTRKALLGQWKNTGVKVGFLVHDLLPVTHCEYFPANETTQHMLWLETISAFDLAVCVSSATADELQAWLAAQGARRERPLRIVHSHNGADVAASAPTRGLPSDAKKWLRILQTGVSFLMVGTLEPRKGHADALDAFERLWARGVDVNLVIVGKKGWMVDALAKRIYASLEYEKRLFWLQGVSDEYLESIYAASACLIAASHAEGFGLPLIEAARHHLPVIARDIPVFREVAGRYASYFSGDLAQTVEEWLAAYRRGEHIRSEHMPWLSWQESARRLWDLVTKDG